MLRLFMLVLLLLLLLPCSQAMSPCVALRPPLQQRWSWQRRRRQPPLLRRRALRTRSKPRRVWLRVR
jgi:hypothetical protein